MIIQLSAFVFRFEFYCGCFVFFFFKWEIPAKNVTSLNNLRNTRDFSKHLENGRCEVAKLTTQIRHVSSRLYT